MTYSAQVPAHTLQLRLLPQLELAFVSASAVAKWADVTHEGQRGRARCGADYTLTSTSLYPSSSS